MADITENDVREFIALKLPSESEIPATDHRAVENKIMDYVVQEFGKVAKSKELLLETWTTERNYSINTGLPAGAKITSVVAMLVCKMMNNDFVVGQVVTSPTPYPADSGRTYQQGIGVQYNEADSSSVKVVVSKQVTIMSAFDPTSGAGTWYVILSGVNTSNWGLKLIVGYK